MKAMPPPVLGFGSAERQTRFAFRQFTPLSAEPGDRQSRPMSLQVPGPPSANIGGTHLLALRRAVPYLAGIPTQYAGVLRANSARVLRCWQRLLQYQDVAEHWLTALPPRWELGLGAGAFNSEDLPAVGGPYALRGDGKRTGAGIS